MPLINEMCSRIIGVGVIFLAVPRMIYLRGSMELTIYWILSIMLLGLQEGLGLSTSQID